MRRFKDGHRVKLLVLKRSWC